MASNAEHHPFSDFVNVAPGLFFGAHPEGKDPFALGPTVVVCLSTRSSSEEATSGRMYVHWPIKDGPLPEIAALDGLAAMLAGWLSLGVGVFIHCDAGMNRSALVAARVLIEQGIDPKDAVALVRERRPGALSEEYADHLRSLEATSVQPFSWAPVDSTSVPRSGPAYGKDDRG
jgi:hypothetical protein